MFGENIKTLRTLQSLCFNIRNFKRRAAENAELETYWRGWNLKIRDYEIKIIVRKVPNPVLQVEPKRLSLGIWRFLWRFRIMRKLRGLFRESTSEALLLPPRYFAISACFNPH